MDLQLNGKTAFVSGSTQGIGYAIASSLAKEGASVIINGRSEGKVNEVVAKTASGFPRCFDIRYRS
ncbi:SDR family NAD(P)-dependent oxidoreductase [Dyadobacter crusticola]|uniref:SDR family NAD(P)-dependent oxidoreductase n=1 Tax=Dyadobacter crusticola TaxID=292407 RepID=UPI000AADA4C9|nr:SDR family NAD(P)-dependent oxidoreductase [Dyadobacter crusticola]